MKIDFAIPNVHWVPCRGCGEPSTSTSALCLDCDRKREDARAARVAFQATIPAELTWSSFGTDLLAARVKPPTAIALAKEAVGSLRVVLTGAAGAGKTSIAVAMARQWVAQCARPASFVVAPTLSTARTRTTFGRESPEVTLAKTIPLLVLDDLGTPQHEPGTSPIVEVVFARHASGLPTWVTTWMNVDDCAQRYGDGVSRRLFERARVIRLEGARG